jgi:hypothetical protein
MSVAVIAGFILGALFLAYRMIVRAALDKTVAQAIQNQKHGEEDKAIAQAQKELEDAQVRYRKSRDELDATLNSIRGSMSETDGGLPPSDS